MKNVASKILNVFNLNKRIGFFLLAIVLFWIKTYITYKTKFNLGVSGSTQEFLLLLNPLPFALFLLGISLYAKGRKSYWILLITDLLLSLWLFANVIYYREFSDFLTITIIKGVGTVSNNMDQSIAQLLHPSDFLIFADIILLVVLLLFKVIKIDKGVFKKRFAFLMSAFAIALFALNLGWAEKDRSGLLTRTFDRNYIVKYLGLDAFAIYDGVKTAQTNATRVNADSSDMDDVLKYLKENKVPANVEYTGKVKGKNVFLIHLESLQQFIIDYKWQDQEVTPTINALYHDQNTLAFDNFFHQVGQGKTSDAEMMTENSLFGLSQGSAMVTAGDNTYQAAPAILDQHGYTTASFHGDVASFWNRDKTYKAWGYDYFFDAQYYPKGENYNVGYGLKDKIFLKESAQYIEQLPQPFYAKMITVTNHYPYPLDKDNVTIEKTETGDKTVDGYVQTARYLDESLKEFFKYLKDTGLYDDSVIVMYGDHYGISSNHRPAVTKLLEETGKLKKDKVDDYEDAMFQKVPFMIHAPGLKGGVNHTYGGEIDVLPTMLNLLGIDNKDMIQFGSDLLSPQSKQIVAFRNGDFVTPKYTKVSSTIYDTNTGEEIETPTKEQEKEIESATKHTQQQLALSDKVITGDLLRFYTPNGFKKVDVSKYNYKLDRGLKQMKNDQNRKNSLIEKNHGKSTVDLYETDAPELKK